MTLLAATLRTQADALDIIASRISGEWRLRESLDGGWLSAFAEMRRGLIVPRSEEAQDQAWRRHYG
jgi:hypothetical protein